MMNLMQKVDAISKLHIPKPKFILKVHKENQSFITMANNPKFTTQTRFIAIKYHYSWKHVKTQSNKDGFIKVVYCSTGDQVADIFTKPTRNEIFFRPRKLLLGW